MNVLKKIGELGIHLSEVTPPSGNFLPAARTGNLLVVSGQTPKLDGKLVHAGKLGAGISEKDGYEAARICAVKLLSILHQYGGGLDNVARIVKAVVFVNAVPDYTGHVAVANGTTDLLVAVFGPDGCPARSAVGVGSLPGGAACEVELTAELKDPCRGKF